MRYRAALLVVALLISACGEKEEIIPRSTTVATTFDGNLITYDVHGRGKTALVFIHCWACNRAFWQGQLSYFEEDYKVIALDLPGHGSSGAQRGSWTIEAFGQDVKAVLDDQKVENAILIGHSMGGPVALAAAKYLDGRVKGVACVDSLHNFEQITPAETMAPFIDAMKQDYRAMMTTMSDAMFPKDGDMDVKAYVLEQALSADQTSVISVMSGFADLDLAALARDAQVPIRCINAAPLPPAIPETTIEANQKYADFDAILMDGVGHYLHLEKPDAFNTELAAIIEQFQ